MQEMNNFKQEVRAQVSLNREENFKTLQELRSELKSGIDESLAEVTQILSQRIDKSVNSAIARRDTKRT